jgi:hypothetical protein
MPPARKSARKPAKSAAGKTTGRRGPAKMTAAHKAALAQGRTMSATVDRYLTAVNTPKRRGRKVSAATLQQRLRAAQERAQSGAGVDKVLAAQEMRDIKTRLAALGTGNGRSLQELETAFVKIAKKFGENRGISYGAWRDAGVPAVVLKRAGITRTRT